MNPNKSKRHDRLAEMMQRKLAQIIQKEIKDPRLPGLITISALTVATDLSHAKVYFTVLGEGKESEPQPSGSGKVSEPQPSESGKVRAEHILNTAASYLRTALARTMKSRTVPQLHFVYDESIEYGKKLSHLIDSVNKPDSDDT